jgi:hypothetical protein
LQIQQMYDILYIGGLRNNTPASQGASNANPRINAAKLSMKGGENMHDFNNCLDLVQEIIGILCGASTLYIIIPKIFRKSKGKRKRNAYKDVP